MAIRVLPNSVQIGKYYLTEGPGGLTFDGGIYSTGLRIKTQAQGETAGYVSGGWNPGPTNTNTIEYFPFAVDSNVADVGDLTVARAFVTGQSSSESGYTSGGTPTTTNVIDKFPFATNSNASDVGDLTVSRYGAAGQSSKVSGYTSGGDSGTPPALTTLVNVIDKFPFATNANASDVGDITVERGYVSGQSSSDFGYTSGGGINPSPPAPSSNVIDKFPFATNANATDVGDITAARNEVAGQSSGISGYTSGGYVVGPNAWTNIIDKFPFATNANATDVGDLTTTRSSMTGQSSITAGYNSGGGNPNSLNIIDKFLFASDANATDVGDISTLRVIPAGQQV